jgi:hypothetical protein
MGRYLPGRYVVVDGGFGRRINDGSGARKVHVASFPGDHHSAEFEDGALHIYSHVDDLGNPARKEFGTIEGSTAQLRSSAGGSLGDSVGGIGSIAELNSMNAKHYENAGRILPRRRA